MNIRCKTYLCVLIMVISCATLAQSKPDAEAIVQVDVLPLEQQDIYRAFLVALPNTECPNCWDGKKKYLLNSVTAVASLAGERDECLVGLDLAPNLDSGKTYEIPPSVTEGLNISLITESNYRILAGKWRKGRRGPAAIVYKPSGIVFTKDHRSALLEYHLETLDGRSYGYGIAVVKFTGREWQLDLKRTLVDCAGKVMD